MHYLHTDYQGSFLLYTDKNGAVEKDAKGNEYRYSYDAWGRPRNATTWEQNSIRTDSSLVSLSGMQPRFDRGYTGHEQMAGFALINMNGRLYDPYLQRFLSPDLVVQSPENSQNYNRYSYCLNNPLRYTDPSGYRHIYSADEDADEGTYDAERETRSSMNENRYEYAKRQLFDDFKNSLRNNIKSIRKGEGYFLSSKINSNGKFVYYISCDRKTQQFRY